jgi:hypothetical protein
MKVQALGLVRVFPVPPAILLPVLAVCQHPTGNKIAGATKPIRMWPVLSTERTEAIETPVQLVTFPLLKPHLLCTPTL